MPRKKVILQNQFPYHVTNRTIDKKFFGISRKIIWDLFCAEAYAMTVLWNGKIHAAVLMSNHFHMLISTPDSNLDDCMMDFQSEFARKISLTLGTDGYRFARRYNSSIIKSEHYFRNVFRYIYMNPVRAKIVSRAEEYHGSTLGGIHGLSPLKIPISPCYLGQEFFENSSSQWIDFINEPFLDSENQAIRAGLRRGCFAPALSKLSVRSRKKIVGENF
jgi:putative transposase